MVARIPVIDIYCRKCGSLLLKYLKRGHSSKMLRQQSGEKYDVSARSLSDLPDNIRTSDCHQATAGSQNRGRKSLLAMSRSLLSLKHAVKDEDLFPVKKLDLQLNKHLLLEEFMKRNQKNDKHFQNIYKHQDFPWSRDLRTELLKVFRFSEFRPLQLEVMNSSLRGDDVIVVMETAAGKSLCFQLPALISPGITLVICPLVSLMEDQIHNLKRFGIKARMLTSNTSQEENMEIMNMLNGDSADIKLLYMTPEKLSKNKKLLNELLKCYINGNLSRVVIDEFHCISEWGNDFRPDYKSLGLLKEYFPGTPIMCLSATSSNQIIEDTKSILNIPSASVFKSNNPRSNLFYDVRMKPMNHKDVVYDITKTIKEHFPNQSGIIYCLSRRNCTDVNSYLVKQGIKSEVYHAMLTEENKTKVYQDWKMNETQVIVATVAFGMGIDKSDVRFVIHHSISKTVHNYYQESGRSGRDGKPSLCLLYFGFNDLFKRLNSRSDLHELMATLDYGMSDSICKHKDGLKCLDKDCLGMCNTCTGMQEYADHDVTEVCRALLDIVRSSAKHVTAIQLVAMATSNRGELANREIFEKFTKSQLRTIVLRMIRVGFLGLEFSKVTSRKYNYVIPGRDVGQQQLTFNLPRDVSVIGSRDNVYEQKLKHVQNVSVSSRDHALDDVRKRDVARTPRNVVTSLHSSNNPASFTSQLKLPSVAVTS